jgi:hypothetical protein
VGGTHTVTNLPTGFDASWLPNDTGLDITDVSEAVDAGYSINASPYNVDIEGISRPDNAYDIGAYEYVGGGATATIVIHAASTANRKHK